MIAFNIPAADSGFDGAVFTIKPHAGFDLFDDGTTIDGATQTAFTGDTNPWGPEIVLDGSEAGGSGGVSIGNSSHNTIRGLVIHSFQNAAIQFSIWSTGSPDHNRVVGCYLGTDATGTLALGNGSQGVAVNGNGNVIGGPDPADRNVMAGNLLFEIQVGGPGWPASTGTIVEGNFIGTDRTGTSALGSVRGVYVRNGSNTLIKGNLISGMTNSSGVILSGGNGSVIQENRIGTDVTGKLPLPNWNPGVAVYTTGNLIENNVIAFNKGPGVLVTGQFDIDNNFVAASAKISQNSIFSNAGLGIGLGGGGVTWNDPGDLDSGPNNLMNYPVLESAHATPGRLVVKGAIDTPDPRSVTIELFANPVPVPGGDPSRHGEGAVFLGSVRPNHKGDFTAPVTPVSPGTLITATATDAAGNTSEFAANIEAK